MTRTALITGIAGRDGPYLAEVLLEGPSVGFVGTAVQHHELGPVALAIVKRTIDPSVVLAVDGVSAAQEVVVKP